MENRNDHEEIKDVVDWVRNRLEEYRRERDVQLTLEERDYRLEDEWLYLVVTPARPGIRASDYAEIMAEIEKELYEKKKIDNVLLVPAINE